MITLITSGDYVNSEMKAEFGLLPPALLPLGTRRLIDHQLETLLSGEKTPEHSPEHGRQIFLSLPQSFQLGSAAQREFAAKGVTLIFVPDGLTLGQSVLQCLDQHQFSGPFSILHGDTLLNPPGPEHTNTHLIGDRVGGYAWGRAVLEGARFVRAEPLAQEEEDHSPVLAGYFSFSCAQDFARSLRCANGDFLKALGQHAADQDVQAQRCSGWADFGHLQTYYRSRAAFASSRAFNNLKIADGLVRKYSEDGDKIKAESDWFSALPARLHPYTARLIDAGGMDKGWQYATEYEHLPTLQELFIFGRLDHVTWDEILDACVQCLKTFAATPVTDAPKDALMRLSEDKTFQRIEQFEAASGVDFSQDMRLNGRLLLAPRRIAEEMIEIVRAASKQAPSVLHGDYCFSNILYNSRTHRVRLIDPRGHIDGYGPCVGGDFRYDMAKLAHSVVGWYDLIIADRFECRMWTGDRLNFEISFEDVQTHQWLVKRFEKLSVAGVSFASPEIKALTILLFLSMLPLHADRPARQTAFLANALRLYQNFS